MEIGQQGQRTAGRERATGREGSKGHRAAGTEDSKRDGSTDRGQRDKAAVQTYILKSKRFKK